VIASLWDGYDNKASFFMLNFYLMMGATLLLVLLLPWLIKVFREYDGKGKDKDLDIAPMAESGTDNLIDSEI
jgi:hypothetical protein